MKTTIPQGWVSGKGKVYNGEKFIADVSFHLIISQELELFGKDLIPGLKKISGEVRAIEGLLDMHGSSTYTLRLVDGRRWSFSPSDGESPLSSHRVTNVGVGGIA